MNFNIYIFFHFIPDIFFIKMNILLYEIYRNWNSFHIFVFFLFLLIYSTFYIAYEYDNVKITILLCCILDDSDAEYSIQFILLCEEYLFFFTFLRKFLDFHQHLKWLCMFFESNILCKTFHFHKLLMFTQFQICIKCFNSLF